MCPSKDKTIAYRARTRCERNKRDRVLDMYGGKCALCGCDKRIVLQLDHVNGDGCVERKELGSTKHIYARALSAYRPDRYRVLCANCNQEERFKNGHYGGRGGRFLPTKPKEEDFGPLFQDLGESG